MRTRARIAVGLLLGPVLLGAALVTLVLTRLDHPFVKSRLQQQVKRHGGVDVDWTKLSVGPHGVRIAGLVVRSPEPVRAQAAELLRAGSIEVDWRPTELPHVRSCKARDVELTVVRLADGRTSLSFLGGPGPPEKKEAPPTPLSRLLASKLNGAPPIDRVELANVSLTLLQPSGKLRASGLALDAELERRGQGFAVHAHTGELDVLVEAGGKARLTLALDVKAEAEKAYAVADVTVREHDFAGTRFRQGRLVHLEADAAFAGGHSVVGLEGVNLVDGAAVLDGEIDVPDEGTPLLRQLKGNLDGARLLALLPAGLVPVTVEKAQLRLALERLLLTNLPRLADGGSARIDAEHAGVRTGPMSLGAGRLSLVASPSADGSTLVHAEAPIDSFADGARLRVGGVGLLVDGTIDRQGRFTGQAKLRAATIAHAPLAAREVEIAVDARAFVPSPLGGQLSADARIARLSAPDLVADGLRAQLRAPLRTAPPFAVEVTAPIGRVRMMRKRATVFDAPARLEVHATDIVPDGARSLAKLQGSVSVGTLKTTFDVKKQARALDYEFKVAAPTLSLLEGVAPGAASWKPMSLALTSKGHVELAGPSLRHKTEAQLDQVAVGDGFRARHVGLTLTSSGSLARHEGELSLRVDDPVIDDVKGNGIAVDGKLAFDRAGSLRLDLRAHGDLGPEARALLALSFDRKRRAIDYEVDAHLAKLAGLAPFLQAKKLAAFDVKQLELSARGKGRIIGVVADVVDGKPRLVADPLSTAAAEGDLELAARHLRWARADRELEVDRAGWHVDLGHDGDRRTFVSTIDTDALRTSLGHHELAVSNVRDRLEVKIDGPIRRGTGELSHHLTIGALKQDFAPSYPTGDLELRIKARRDTDGVVHVTQLRLDNRAGGTALALQGGLDIGGGRLGLSLRGEVEQELARLSTRDFNGKGKARIPLQIETANLRLFHAQASLRIAGASIALPAQGISIENIDGEIPLSADLVLGRDGLRFLRNTRINAYSELRFADQHPLIHSRSFLTIGRVVTPWLTMAPFTGNLRVEQNIISMSQLEMGVRGGRVTGRCLVDWREDGTNLHLHVRATGVQASEKQPFDGNAAVVIATRERSIDGRAEILRIGKQHLYDLLDFQDPQRANPAINRIRRALKLGYPDKVRLSFKRGFASAKVTFGGIARLISIDEVRGIPMGPLVDKFIAPLYAKEEP